MKRLALTLCVFITMIAAANAEFYMCVNSDGDTELTENHQQDGKCEAIRLSRTLLCNERARHLARARALFPDEKQITRRF